MYQALYPVISVLLTMSLLQSCKAIPSSGLSGVVFKGSNSFLVYEGTTQVHVSCVDKPLPEQYKSMSTDELIKACQGISDLSFDIGDFRLRLNYELSLKFDELFWTDFKTHVQDLIKPALESNRAKLAAFAVVGKESSLDLSSDVARLQTQGANLSAKLNTTRNDAFNDKMAEELGQYFQEVKTFNRSYASMFSQLLIDSKVQTISSASFPLLNSAVNDLIRKKDTTLPIGPFDNRAARDILSSYSKDIQPLPITSRSNLSVQGPPFEYTNETFRKGETTTVSTSSEDLFILYSDGEFYHLRGGKTTGMIG